MAAEKTVEKKNFFKDNIVKIILTLVIVLLVGIASTFSYLYYQEKGKKSQTEVESILTDIGKLIEVPSDEIPTIATVTDKTKLQNQTILKKAENGDKVIIYSKAQKAILYRPSTKKIVDVVPVNTATPTPVSITASDSAKTETFIKGAETGTAVIRTYLYNGTNTVGLTKKAQPKITSVVPQITVVDTDNAAVRSYKDTIIIDVSKKFASNIKEIADKISATVSDLPEGQTAPDDADYLIILGKDSIE